MKAISELLSDLEKINQENILFHKNCENRTGRGWAQWSEYQEWINFNIATLDSVARLVQERRYRDCYILLRPVLEAYMIIKLSMLGNVQFYDLLPKGTGKTKESKADLLQRAKTDPNLNKLNIKKLKLIDDDRGYRVRIFFRDKPVQGTQVYVPRHYFFSKDFDPDTVYLSDLISKNQWQGVSRPDKKYRNEHRNIQKYFLSIHALQDFFEVNGFASPRQIDAIFVHYSYLSRFVHSTVRSYESISGNRRAAYLDNMESLFSKDSMHELLILLYCVFLSSYFLELQIAYFSKQPDLKISLKRRAEIRAITKDMGSKYSFFWFIYNKPYIFDIFQYRLKRAKMSQTSKVPLLPYYVDPFVRLRDLRSGWSNPILGAYNPPVILF